MLPEELDAIAGAAAVQPADLWGRYAVQSYVMLWPNDRDELVRLARIGYRWETLDDEARANGHRSMRVTWEPE